MADIVCKHCGLTIEPHETRYGPLWTHSAHYNSELAQNIATWFSCDYAEGLDVRETERRAEPAPSNVSGFVIESVPVPVAKKAKKIKKIKTPVGVKTTCKHCGLAIEKLSPANKYQSNTTGWQHHAGWQFETCYYAFGDNKKDNPFKKPNHTTYKESEQAEPSDEWLEANGFNQLTPMLLIGKSQVVKMKFKTATVIPAEHELCMYCNEPVNLSTTATFLLDWEHCSGAFMCDRAVTLDGLVHTADTFNVPNVSSNKPDKEVRTAFFEFLKNNHKKSAVSIPAHDGTFPVGRKFRHEKSEKE